MLLTALLVRQRREGTVNHVFIQTLAGCPSYAEALIQQGHAMFLLMSPLSLRLLKPPVLWVAEPFNFPKPL